MLSVLERGGGCALAPRLPRHRTSWGQPPHGEGSNRPLTPLCISRAHYHRQWPGEARSRKSSVVVGSKSSTIQNVPHVVARMGYTHGHILKPGLSCTGHAHPVCSESKFSVFWVRYNHLEYKASKATPVYTTEPTVSAPGCAFRSIYVTNRGWLSFG